jgi:hypothetical protein
MNKYDFKLDIKNEEEAHREIDKKLKETKQKREHFVSDSAQERIRRIHEIKSNPPEPGYMKQTLHEAKIQKGEQEVGRFIVIKDENGDIETDDEENVLLLEPIITIDLKTLAEAQFADTASNVIPMLMDQAVQTAMSEKKEYKPEKPQKEFAWQWVILTCSFVPMIIFFTGMILGWW